MARWISLFRAVDGDELRDLSASRSFRTVPGSLEAKLFWTTRRDATLSDLPGSWLRDLGFAQLGSSRLRSSQPRWVVCSSCRWMVVPFVW